MTSSVPAASTPNSTLSRRDWLVRILFLFGSSFIIFAFNVLLIRTFLFLFQLPFSFLTLPGALILTLVYLLATSYKYFPVYPLLNYFILFNLLIASLIASVFISSQFIDISYDGQAYHQEAIIQLRRGWNPLYERLSAENANYLDRWVNHYAKGPWLHADTIYRFTGDIESGKAFNWLYILSSFALVMSCLLLYPRFDYLLSVLISLLLAFNPVSMYQTLSYYVDGQLISLLITLLAVFFHIFHSKNGGKTFLLLCLVVVLLNVKLSAVVYTVAASALFLLLLWIYEKISAAVGIFRVLLAAFLFGLGVIGYNPYITNIQTRGNPFYPAAGRGAVDYTASNMPNTWLRKSNPSRFLLSLFSPSANLRGGNYLPLKIPFTITPKELDTFTDTNAKQSGFGPLFSGSLVLSAIFIYSVLFLHIFKRRTLPKAFLVTIFIVLVIVVTAAVNPLSPVARYVPYVWFVPVIFIIFSFITTFPLLRFIGILILYTLLANNYLIARTYYSHNLRATRDIKTTLARLSRAASDFQNEPLLIVPGEFDSSIKNKLNRYGIPWEEISSNLAQSDSINCQRMLPGTIVEFCSSSPKTAASLNLIKPTLSE